MTSPTNVRVKRYTLRLLQSNCLFSGVCGGYIVKRPISSFDRHVKRVYHLAFVSCHVPLLSLNHVSSWHFVLPLSFTYMYVFLVENKENKLMV